MNSVNLAGKTVALYGLGDQLGYGHYFLDAMGWLHGFMAESGARLIGYWSTEGYFYEESKALNSDQSQFVGLAIDDDQQFELTDSRVKQWVEQVAEEYELAAAAN